MTETPTTRTAYQSPPWPAAVAALLAYLALALSSAAVVPLLGLGIGLAASYMFRVRFENETLTKWSLRIIVMGGTVFAYLVTATKDEYAFFDVRYINSFALAAAAEMTLQFWRREPTGGARAPFTVFLSAMILLVGSSSYDEGNHTLWLLAPAFFLFFAFALPGFRQRTGGTAAIKYAALPVLAALLLGALTYTGVSRHKSELNFIGSQALSGRRVPPSMGMSGQPLLGPSFTLRDSLTRVLRIRNIGQDPYLRGMTFDTYAGHSWGLPLDNRVFLTLPRQTGAAGGPRARFVRLDDSIGLLFAPLHSALIVPEGGHSLEWSPRTEGPIRTPAVDTDPLTYDISAGPAGLLEAPPTPAEEARDLVVPPDIDRRVLALAEKVGAGHQAPSDKIEAVIHFLYANNQYSLTVNPGAGEPISGFILEHKAAHCEFFASAAVVLLRSLGIPTRYVSGYYAHEGDGRGWTLVRQRDAHAWAESWVPGTGWVTVDATPGNGRPDALAGPIPVYWRLWEMVQDVLGAVRNWVITASWAEKGTVFLLLVLGLLVPQVYRYLQRRRFQSSGFRYANPDAALALLSDRFDALLVRRGLPCPDTRTWPEHLDLTPLGDDLSMGRFVESYGHARFGPIPTRDAITELDFLLQQLEKQPVEKKAAETHA